MEDQDTQVFPRTTTEESENGHKGHGLSLLEQLVAKRSAAAGEHFYEMEVPGYDGCLVLRLAPLRGQELSTLARRADASKSPDREFNANCDIIIRACQEIVGRESRDEELRTIHPDEETPVTLGEEFAEMFGLEATSSSRELLRQLWAAVPSPEIAIGLAAGEFVQWSSEASGEDAERFAGE